MTLLLALTLAFTNTSEQSTYSLRAAARASSDPVIRVLLGETTPLTLSELTARSAAIVRGVLIRGKTYLSEDETEIYTLYDLLPSEVIGDRQDLHGKSISVRFLGGTLQLEGNTVTMRVQDLPLPDDNLEGFFFLRQGRQPAVYTVVASQYGIFRVEGNRVWPLKTALPHNESIAGVDVGEFTSRLEKIALRLPRFDY